MRIGMAVASRPIVPMTSPATIQPIVPSTRTAELAPGRASAGTRSSCSARASACSRARSRGARKRGRRPSGRRASRITPPTRCSAARMRSRGQEAIARPCRRRTATPSRRRPSCRTRARSARPEKPSVCPSHVPIVTDHAPHTKYCRNISVASRTQTPGAITRVPPSRNQGTSSLPQRRRPCPDTRIRCTRGSATSRASSAPGLP